jgi:hypothetical protein
VLLELPSRTLVATLLSVCTGPDDQDPSVHVTGQQPCALPQLATMPGDTAEKIVPFVRRELKP